MAKSPDQAEHPFSPQEELRSKAPQNDNRIEPSPEQPPEANHKELVPKYEASYRGKHSKRVPEQKRRSTTMAFSVSPEEKAIIKAYVGERGWNFSSWARQSLFRTMGKKVPSRLGRGRPPKVHDPEK